MKVTNNIRKNNLGVLGVSQRWVFQILCPVLAVCAGVMCSAFLPEEEEVEDICEPVWQVGQFELCITKSNLGIEKSCYFVRTSALLLFNIRDSMKFV